MRDEGRSSVDTGCFDPSCAEYRTRVVPISEVTDLLPITHAEEVIADYRRRMIAGERFPPVSVVRLFGRFVIADGHKRFTAGRDLHDDIVVEVWPWSRWLRDQCIQAVANGRKNWRIVRNFPSRPSESLHLAATTFLHWKRVFRCVILRRRAAE